MSDDFQSVWINAITDARRALKPEALREIYNKTDLVLLDDLFTVAKFTNGYVRVDKQVYVLPEIEQREVMLYIIAMRHAQLTGIAEGEYFDILCHQLGCLPLDTYSIAERWRKLGILRDITKLPYYGLESRPHCKICTGIIPTGAGWLPSPEDTGRLAIPRQDIHHGCMQHARYITAPAVRAARVAEAQIEAARKDK
jgi:hypothetical protein